MLHFKRGAGPGGSDRAEYWTRNSKNGTAIHREAMAPVLASCLRKSLDECILDGEMMVWNTQTCEFAPFGDNRSLGDYQRRIAQHQQPCFVVFDAVWLNGRALDKLPLSERREAIAPHVAWEAHSMELSRVSVVEPNTGPSRDPTREESTSHNDEVMKTLDRAMAHGYEGVVFKSLRSVYLPGARDTDWVKLKPDYVHEMGDELDLIILAGYFGEGVRRGGAISHFLLGLEAPPSERARFQSDHPLFYPFVKVGTG